MPSLTSFPTELLLEINSHLYPIEQHQLLLTSRHFRDRLGSLYLTKVKIIDELMRMELLERIPLHHSHALSVAVTPGTPYKRVCNSCLHLQSFFHFSVQQAGTRHGKNKKRTCLDCQEAYNGPETQSRYPPGRCFFNICFSRCLGCWHFIHSDPTPKYDRTAHGLIARKLDSSRRITEHQCGGSGGGGGGGVIAEYRERLVRLEGRLPRWYLLVLRAVHQAGEFEIRVRSLEKAVGLVEGVEEVMGEEERMKLRDEVTRISRYKTAVG